MTGGRRKCGLNAGNSTGLVDENVKKNGAG